MTSFVAFGRSRYDEPLHQLGELDAGAGDAAEQAREGFADGLIELALVPRDEMTLVFRREDSDEAPLAEADE